MKQLKSKPIEQIEEEAEKDLVLRIDRTEEDQANTPSLHHKYHKQYRLVKTELIQAGNSLLKLRRDKWFYYTGKAKPRIYDPKVGGKPLNHKIMKSDIKMVIDSDDEVIKATYNVEMIEMKLKFIREKMDTINRRSYEINNIIKTMYFKHGIS